MDEATILHADLDAFYASVEQRDDPRLRSRPVIVGSGVVLAASYEAKAYGVRTAMSGGQARRLCPQAVVVAPRMSAYSEASEAVFAVFRHTTPLVEGLSIDEAFLDVRGVRRLIGSPRVVASLLRREVRERVGLPITVGVARTKFLAKVASGVAKPDGLLVVPADGVVAFLHPLPVAALWGVGERTEQTLGRLGLHTVGDLAATPLDTLKREVGDAVGEHLHDLAWGRDERPVVASVKDKSIGAEETFDVDIADAQSIRRELLRLSDRVGSRLRESGHVGRTIAIKLRRDDFTTITRSRTLREPTDLAREIYATACALYEASGLAYTPLRLVGVRVENLVSADTATRQLSLGDPETGWREAEQAMDLAARRFGAGAVRPAALVRPDAERNAYYGKERPHDD
jgi:DNA polymerase-4